MGCNVCKYCTTVQETESIGEEFASKYFDVLTATSDAAGLNRFYDNRSTYVLLQSGQQSDLVAHGVDEIIRFVIKMNYHKSTVNIESMNTVNVHSDWFFVLMVGKLLRFEEQIPQNFVQITIMKHTLSSRKCFRIRKTLFKFNDVDDILKPATEPDVLSTMEHQPLNHRVKVTKDESIKNNMIENSKKHFVPVTTNEPGMCIDKLTEEQQSVVLKHVPEESIDSDIERPEKLIGDTTISHNETNNRQKHNDQKPYLVLKHDSEESIKKNNRIEDEERSVNTVISPIESRELRKIMTDKQSEVLKHILQNHESQLDDNKKTISGIGKSIDSKIEQNSTKEKRTCTDAKCSESSVDKSCNGSVKKRIDELSYDGNIPKASNQRKPVKNQPNKMQPFSAKNISSKDLIETDVGPAENLQGPITSTDLLYVGGLSHKIKLNDLRNYFARFGRVISVSIFCITDKESPSKRQNFGIVRYENPETVDVVAKLGTVSLDNGNIVILKTSKEN